MGADQQRRADLILLQTHRSADTVERTFWKEQTSCQEALSQARALATVCEEKCRPFYP